MKRKIKILITILIMIFTIIIFNEVKAASANITSNKTEIQVGDTVTVTVNTTAGAWNLSVNGGGLSSSDTSGLVGQTNKTANDSASKTYTFTATKSGNFTITLNGDITDYDTEEKTKISKTVNITVKDAATNNNNNENNNNNTTTPETPITNEPTFKSTNEKVYTTQTVNIRDTYSTSGAKIVTLNKGDSLTRTGIGSNGWDRVTYNGKTGYMIHSALTTTEPEKEEEEEKSTNKSLKELIVEDYELTPAFNPETTKYTLTLKETDKTLNIKATSEDEKATVSITGNESFKVGNNIVKITVTAEDGTTRIYTITVSKTNEDGAIDGLKLKSLHISNATLEPSFDPEVTNYIITVDDPSTVKAENISAVAEDEDVTVTVAENEQSEDGEKVITIMLESKDGEKTGIYQITVKKPEINQVADITNNIDNSIYYILGGIIAVLLILIIIIIIVLKKTSNKDNEEDIKDADELSDDYDYSLKGAIDEANSEYDEMVEQTNFKSQILNSNLDNSNFLNDSDDVNKPDDEDYKPNVSQKKKGKHF